jgi:hypothetical protein
LPLKIILLELFSRRKKIVYLILIIFVITIQLLAGNPQLVFISFVALVFYSIYTLYLPKKVNFFQLCLLLFFLGSGSICGAAVQILPTLELYKLSRGNLQPSFEFMTQISASPRILLSYFFHFGYPEEYGLNIKRLGYMDVYPFLLVLFGLFLRKDRLTKFFFISLLISIVLSLGKYNPLYKLYLYIPLINQMRYPILFLFIASFFISILAGFSLNYILNLETEIRKKELFKLTLKIITLVYILLIIFSVFTYREENIYFSLSDFFLYFIKETKFFIILSLIIFLIFSLYFSGKISANLFKKINFIFLFFTIFLSPPYLIPSLNDVDYIELLREENIDKDIYITPSSIYPENPEYVDFLKKEKGFFRVYNDYKKTPLQRSLGLLYKIPCIIGYLPLHLARFEKYLTLLYEDIYTTGLNLMNVKFILDKKMEGVPIGIENEIERLVYNNEISIIENKNCLPRAFIVYKNLFIKDEDEILEKLGDVNFNPKEYVILEEKPKLVQSPDSTVQNLNSSAEIIKYSPLELIINANLKENGFLFLSDTYYPGWKVYVNGKEDKIYRANYLFRAVYLKKGKNEVRFVYEPIIFKIGLLISILTILVLTGIIIKSFCTNKKLLQ